MVTAHDLTLRDGRRLVACPVAMDWLLDVMERRSAAS
jgi:hypothetical protein